MKVDEYVDDDCLYTTTVAVPLFDHVLLIRFHGHVLAERSGQVPVRNGQGNQPYDRGGHKGQLGLPLKLRSCLMSGVFRVVLRS